MSRGKVSIDIGRKSPKAPEPPEKSPVGGRYVLQQELGRGGVGEVLLAYDLQLERPVAVKRVHMQMGESSHRAQVAMTEAKRLARLQHPNIVTVFDVFDHRGDVLMVMEYLYGYTIEALESPLPQEDFLNLARQSLTGLAAAHSLGMIHLDIKPTNLMLTWLATGQLQVKLLDFGLAKMMEQPAPQDSKKHNSVLGSIHTMAPEQLEQDPVDARTDLYSLGCVFYYALTRRDPFAGNTVEDIMENHLSHRFLPLAPQRPDLPPGLCAWVERLISRHPKDRPENATAALTQLFSSANLSTRKRATAPLGIDVVEIHLPNRDLLLASVGKKAAVHGLVARVWENAPGTACFLNFETVEHRHFSVVLVQKDHHPEFARERLKTLIGKKIRVTGSITDFHGSPQLVVDSPAQIDTAAHGA